MKFGLRYANLGRYANGPAAVELAQAAEAAGFDSIWTVEHVVVPHGYQSRYPYSDTGRMGAGLEDFTIPDPLIWLTYIASATRTLKLGTAILILPQRNPVITAKAVASLDHLAGGGRVLLGIGVGWLAEEFATLGVPFEDRGPRTDEYVAAMRALWSQECASYRGRFVSFDQVFCRPLPPERRIPIIVGGDTPAAALRVGDTVLQSGTTAIDRQGNVHGEGDVARQVDAIMRIAEWSMGKAGGRLADVVRSRIYVTDVTVADQAARAVARYLTEARPAATLVQVNRLARPAQLIEIELDAVDGAGRSAQRISSGRPVEEQYAYSRAVRVGDRVFISGSTALNARGQVEAPGDMYRQTRATMDTIIMALAEAGGTPGDIVYTKTFLTDLGKAADYTRAWLEALGDVRPTSTLLAIRALIGQDMLIEVEAEAVL